jgi:protein-disulfide isomerase
MDENKLPKKFFLLLALIAVAVIGIFAFFVFNGPKPAPRISNYDLENENAAGGAVAPPVLPSDPFLGPDNAANTIIEFGDYECPTCAAASSELIALLGQRSDTRLVWKDYPMDAHPNAEPAAEAARCAGDQGKYWQFHDVLFANQDNLSDQTYMAAAAGLKLDLNAFTACLQNGTHRSEVAAGVAAGDAAAINELPFIFINGEPYPGGVTAQELNAVLPAKN